MFLWQELSQVRAAAVAERARAEEELLKARSQARLEEVRTGLAVAVNALAAQAMSESWGAAHSLLSGFY